MNQPLVILALLAALSCCQAAPAQQSREASAVQSTPGFSQLSVSGDHGSLLVMRGPGGQITAVLDGAVVPPERVRREGDRLSILDETGAVAYEMRTLPDGGLVFPYDAKVSRLWSGATPMASWYSSSEPRKVIGVMVDAVDASLASQLGLEPEAAFVISGVTPGFPAEKAGLQPYDVVVSIQGESPATVERLREALDEKQPGDTIKLELLRRGQRMEVEVGVGEEREPQFLLGEDDLAAGMAGVEAQMRSLSESVERRQAEIEATRERLVDLEVELAEASAALEEARQDSAAGDESAKEEVLRRKVEVDALRRELAQQQRRLESGSLAMQLLDMSGGSRALVLPPNSSLFGAAAPEALPADVNDRLRAMDERLSRLEELLEKLVESDAAK